MSELTQTNDIKKAFEILEARITLLEAITKATGANIRLIDERLQALEDSQQKGPTHVQKTIPQADAEAQG